MPTALPTAKPLTRSIIAGALAVIGLSSSIPAMASYTDAGTITRMTAWKQGYMMFVHTGNRTSTAACQNPNDANSWALDTTTSAGQAEAAMLLTAYVTNRRVAIVGTGVCDVSSNRETVGYVGFAD